MKKLCLALTLLFCISCAFAAQIAIDDSIVLGLSDDFSVNETHIIIENPPEALIDFYLNEHPEIEKNLKELNLSKEHLSSQTISVESSEIKEDLSSITTGLPERVKITSIYADIEGNDVLVDVDAEIHLNMWLINYNPEVSVKASLMNQKVVSMEVPWFLSPFKSKIIDIANKEIRKNI